LAAAINCDRETTAMMLKAIWLVRQT